VCVCMCVMYIYIHVLYIHICIYEVKELWHKADMLEYTHTHRRCSAGAGTSVWGGGLTF
jgi:hypothetical protein